MNEKEQLAADCLLDALPITESSEAASDIANAYQALCEGFLARCKAGDIQAHCDIRREELASRAGEE